jgi:3'-phosphoadenosine 5'-phosphosulfate sulfotransferase (PAPS reductase)/FAD synthetase
MTDDAAATTPGTRQSIGDRRLPVGRGIGSAALPVQGHLFAAEASQAEEPEAGGILRGHGLTAAPEERVGPSDLDTYDWIVVAFSGGKDSVACLLHLLEEGVDPARIELWHHLVDGREGSPSGERGLMDWDVTEDYCRRVARHFGCRIYYTWKEGGFEGEMLRENARTAPISFEVPLEDCVGLRPGDLPRQAGPAGRAGSTGHTTVEGHTTVKRTGGTRGKEATRRRYPQVSQSLTTRWCSAYLKIDNARTALRNQRRFEHARTLFVSGERAEESLRPGEFSLWRRGLLPEERCRGRAGYRPFEPDDADARDSAALRRQIDRWRPVHAWSAEEVWAVIERWRINPHPAYRIGFGRCSCAWCIFNGKDQFATLRAVDPGRFERHAAYEASFGWTMKRDVTLPELADRGTPYSASPGLIRLALSDTFDEPVVLPEEEWALPPGAFGESCGPS